MLPHLNNVDILSLLYADDLALMSSTSSGLAVQFETLTRYDERWGLSINIKSINIKKTQDSYILLEKTIRLEGCPAVEYRNRYLPGGRLVHLSRHGPTQHDCSHVRRGTQSAFGGESPACLAG